MSDMMKDPMVLRQIIMDQRMSMDHFDPCHKRLCQFPCSSAYFIHFSQ